jgi:hypothetical protein
MMVLLGQRDPSIVPSLPVIVSAGEWHDCATEFLKKKLPPKKAIEISSLAVCQSANKPTLTGVAHSLLIDEIHLF